MSKEDDKNEWSGNKHCLDFIMKLIFVGYYYNVLSTLSV